MKEIIIHWAGPVTDSPFFSICPIKYFHKGQFTLCVTFPFRQNGQCSHCHVQSPSRTEHDRRPAIISIKYAAHWHGMHFLLSVNYWNFSDDRNFKMCNKKNIETYLIFSTLHFFVPTTFLSRQYHYTSYLTYNSSHLRTNSISFSSFLKTKTGSSVVEET
jgi:hypothetical protein